MTQNEQPGQDPTPRQVGELRRWVGVAAATFALAACNAQPAETTPITTPGHEIQTEVPAPGLTSETVITIPSSQQAETPVTSRVTIEAPAAAASTMDMNQITATIFGPGGLPKTNESTGASLVTVSLTNDGFTTSSIAPNMSLDALTPIEKAITDNELWLKTAHDAGALEEIRFNIFDPIYARPDGSPEYVPAMTGEANSPVDAIEYDLPSSGTVSTEVMTTMIRHEANHALVEGLDIVDRSDIEIPNGAVEPVDLERYTQLCTTIRDTAITQALPYAGGAIEAVGQLAQMVEPAQREIVAAVHQSLLDGTFANYQATQGSAGGKWESVIQACRVDNPWNVIGREFDKAGVAWPDLKNQLELNDPIDVMYDDWQNAIKNHSTYRLIREATYFAEGSTVDDTSGHPYDNVNELLASLITIATRYPQELRANIGQLPADEQQVMRDLLALTASDITRMHSGAPEFVAAVNDPVAEVLR
jgi:hypothetical protein